LHLPLLLVLQKRRLLPHFAGAADLSVDHARVKRVALEHHRNVTFAKCRVIYHLVVNGDCTAGDPLLTNDGQQRGGATCSPP
jgi:hypothetical protein